jgi:hypothetical protein
MISFLLVLIVAVTTLYMGVYVAESLEGMEMRRCPQANPAADRKRDL